MIWDSHAECMPVRERERLQLERLRKAVKRAYDNVPFFKKRFTEAKVGTKDIRTLKDITQIPFTTKADLRECYPFGMFAVPRSEIVEVHTSSGTTGKPVVAGYT